jgi:hypothetical protein
MCIRINKRVNIISLLEKIESNVSENITNTKFDFSLYLDTIIQIYENNKFLKYYVPRKPKDYYYDNDKDIEKYLKYIELLKYAFESRSITKISKYKKQDILPIIFWIIAIIILLFILLYGLILIF